PPPPPMKPTYRSLFGEPLTPDSLLFVALFVSAAATCAGVADGFVCRYSAAAPATCGEAIDVPDIVALPEVLLRADVMLLPGAKMSTQLPQFEKLDRESLEVDEPTVIASATRAGDTLHAFWFSLPAATTTVTPRAVALRI